MGVEGLAGGRPACSTGDSFFSGRTRATLDSLGFRGVPPQLPECVSPQNMQESTVLRAIALSPPVSLSYHIYTTGVNRRLARSQPE